MSASPLPAGLHGGKSPGLMKRWEISDCWRKERTALYVGISPKLQTDKRQKCLFLYSSLPGCHLLEVFVKVQSG